MKGLSVWPLPGIPLLGPGDDLALEIATAIRRTRRTPKAGDVLVLAQKAVSKAEGRQLDLEDVAPGPEAVQLAGLTGQDARLVEVILMDTSRVVRASRGTLIVETKLGLVCANAGVDQSNTGRGVVLRLPVDPDASADRLRTALRHKMGVDLAVIVSDSHGRPWRMGTVGVAIGASGIAALTDFRGQTDLFGRTLHSTEVAVVDALAAAAVLVMGEAAEATPAVMIRGASFSPVGDGGVRALRRAPERDLFR